MNFTPWRSGAVPRFADRFGPRSFVMDEVVNSQKPEARRQRLAEVVLSRGSATAQELASEFEVSLMTIHRDLDELERRGIVRKFRGGVTAQPSGVFESNVAFRMKTMIPEKQNIARHAMRYVEPGMSVILDDSTTALQMVPLIGEAAPVHVATNFHPAIDRLREQQGVRLISFGGDYDPHHDSFLGVICLQSIESIRADAVFLSTSALAGAFAYHQEERVVSFKRAMFEAAGKRYLLIDHSKIGRVALHKLLPLNAFDLVIVDSGTPTAALDALAREDLRFEVGPP
jgi:DeoR/GlpR family transcriptional regulator of sugar metabolism